MPHHDSNNIKLAYFYFKLAAEFGSAEGLYYLAFYNAFNLDGIFNVKLNIEAQVLENSLTEDDSFSIKLFNNYIKNK